MKYFQTWDLLQHSLGRGEGTGWVWMNKRGQASYEQASFYNWQQGPQAPSRSLWECDSPRWPLIGQRSSRDSHGQGAPWRKAGRRPPLIPHTRGQAVGAAVTWEPPFCPIARLLSHSTDKETEAGEDSITLWLNAQVLVFQALVFKSWLCHSANVGDLWGTSVSPSVE